MGLIMGLVGMATLLSIAFIFSTNRKAINLRTVGGAFAIQAGIGAFVLYFPPGRVALEALSNGVSSIIGFSQNGIDFLFGGLVSGKMFEVFGGGGFVFAFRVLPIIIFFSSLISVLYYLGIMQWIIRLLGGALQKALGTSRAESLSATANIFVGQTEAPLVIRPFIANMTQSELFAVMCGGLASVAGAVMAGYAAMGVKMEYLVAASFMAAPGGLLFAKMIIPETEKTADDEDIKDVGVDESVNVIDAAANGASAGLSLALNVGAMLLAFIALLAMLNGLCSSIGGLFGMPELSMELILGWCFSPLAFLMGVPWSEAVTAGSFLGQKLIVNEFVAYLNFAPYIKGEALIAGVKMSDSTQAIVSFALCGFANLSSIAILLGGLGALAPNRRSDIANMGLRAVLAGTLSNLMSATLAGFFLALTAM